MAVDDPSRRSPKLLDISRPRFAWMWVTEVQSNTVRSHVTVLRADHRVEVVYEAPAAMRAIATMALTTVARER